MKKVKFFDKQLLEQSRGLLSLLSTILSFLMVFDYNIFIKVLLLFLVAIILVVKHCCSWNSANNSKIFKGKFNGTDVIVKFGNIFEQEGCKVIAFNEYFDTLVDNNIISEKSLNGAFINQYHGGKEKLDEVIVGNERLNDNIIERDVVRPHGGKTEKYRLGTICPVDNDFLLAFSHFDDKDRAYLSVEDYISCLMHMWNELDRYYASRDIVIPLLGGGITRFNDSRINPQELLRYMLITYKASRIRFKNSKLVLVLSEDIESEINLFELNTMEE